MQTDSAVLLSVQPKSCNLIATGQKHIEIRKTRPKYKPPFTCYIYQTQETRGRLREIINDLYGGGKVIGEFVCDQIDRIEIRHFSECGHANAYCSVSENPNNNWRKESCLTESEIVKYGKLETIFAWHISDLEMYDKPKELTEYRRPCIWAEMPYCPMCPVGGEYISETEAEFYRVDGECPTEWYCNNYVKRAPQSWCYVEPLYE